LSLQTAAVKCYFYMCVIRWCERSVFKEWMSPTGSTCY